MSTPGDRHPLRRPHRVALLVGQRAMSDVAATRCRAASSRSCPRRGASGRGASSRTPRSGGGAPPSRRPAARIDERSPRSFSERGLHGDPDGGHAPTIVTRSAWISSTMSRGCGSGPAKIWVGPDHHAGVRHAPGVGVEHGHYVQDDVALAEAEDVAHGEARSGGGRPPGASRRHPSGGRWSPTCRASRRRPLVEPRPGGHGAARRPSALVVEGTLRHRGVRLVRGGRHVLHGRAALPASAPSPATRSRPPAASCRRRGS